MATASPSQPKIVQKLLLRTFILLVALGILFGGYRYFEAQKNDFNRGTSNGAGIVAAVQKTDDGSEAVLIMPDHSIKTTSSYHPGTNDRDLVWRPDGRFLFFTSDRTNNTFHIYRWNPDDPDAEARTTGTRSRTKPSFPADDDTTANDSMLVVSGGTIQQLDPKTKQTPQILPPMTSTITDSSADEQGGGSEALFNAMYGNLGTSFRYGRYCRSNQYIAAIMERDGGEVLVVQSMTAKDGKLPLPIPVVGGDHVDFDINPKDGTVVYSAEGFQWADPGHIPEQFKKGNQIIFPFRHVIGSVDPDKGLNPPIAASKDDKLCFGAPAISPDGSRIVFSVGAYDRTSQHLTPKALVSCPNHEGGMQGGSKLIDGEVYEPSWSKDGNSLVYAMRANGKRDIFTAHSDGSSPTNLTQGKGDFSNPIFNPQGSATK